MSAVESADADVLSAVTDVAEFIAPAYSRKQIEEAGRALASKLHYCPETVEAFRVAHNHRASYAYPMHRIRFDLAGKVRRGNGEGITAARLKRMSSIRRKLKNTPLTLYQMQDIAGCRAILPAMSDVRRVQSFYESEGGRSHRWNRTYDYVEKPKRGGYRCIHLVLKFQEERTDAAFNRCFIEVQLRTRLQHAWATAVEAVGLVRNENLKAGEGDADWLRLFDLMSAEFSDEEGSLIEGELPADTHVRRSEIEWLEHKLSAIQHLDNYNEAIRAAEHYGHASTRFFIIQYDIETRTVYVYPYKKFVDGSSEYSLMEAANENTTSVLVEVDKAQDLRDAYPNYFLDVKKFTARLKRAVRAHLKRSVRQRESDASSWTDSVDLSWVREYGRKK